MGEVCFTAEELEALPTLKFQVLYGPDENGVIVLNKPSGIDAFGTKVHQSGYPPMIDVLREHWPLGGAPHRIDRGTSGIHVWAENSHAKSILSKEWPICKKTYLAVVDDEPKWDSLDLTMKVKNAHSPGQPPNIKPCTTRFVNLGGGALSAQLVRGGRNHQIRRAAKALGTPLRGDFIYGGSKDGGQVVIHEGKLKKRFLLHAWKWEWRDIAIQARLPKDMSEWEPGGFTRSRKTIEVHPLTIDQYHNLAEFRRNNKNNSLAYPYGDSTTLRVSS